MKGASLRQALEAAQEPERMTKLVERVLSEGRETAHHAVALWLENDEELSRSARDLLSQSEELALDGLLRMPQTSDLAKVVWALRTLAEIEAELRGRIAAKLTSYLENKIPVPQPEIWEPLEEPVPETRLCDEAYMLLRRLQVGEPVGTYEVNVRRFTRLPESERDQEIHAAKEKGNFTNWDKQD